MKTIAIAALLAGCTTMQPYTPARAPSKDDDATLYKRAVRVMEDRGLVVTSKDRDALTVTTEWSEESINATRHRLRWHVTVGDGKVMVMSQCESWMDEAFAADHWEKCSVQPESRAADGEAMAKEIAGN